MGNSQDKLAAPDGLSSFLTAGSPDTLDSIAGDQINLYNLFRAGNAVDVNH